MYVCMYVCMCVCVCSPLPTYGDEDMETHQNCGVCSVSGDILRPQKKDPLNRVFMAFKPYNWGHLRGTHKLVKILHKLGPHK